MKAPKSFSRGLIFLALGFFFLTCDRIEPPYAENPGDRCGDASGPIAFRRVLLEDFTGHLCTNCPRAHRKAEELKGIYCDRIIPVSIHSGNLTETNDTYTYDFTTDAGDSIRTRFNVDSKPRGMFNRIPYNGDLSYNDFKWDAAMDALWLQPAEAEVTVNMNYNAGTRLATATIDVDFFKDFAEAIDLTVYVLEDSIISMQLDGEADPPDVPDYVHRHVFRAAPGGAWGRKIADQTSTGMHLSRQYGFVLPAEWNDRHISVVAFISKMSDSQVIQAGEAELP